MAKKASGKKAVRRPRVREERRESRGRQSRRLEHTMLPEVETLVTIQTVPNAVCFLSHPGVPGQRLRLDADEQGLVRFHAKAAHNSRPIEMHLECTGEDGKKTRYTIALRGEARHRAPVSTDAAPAAARGTGKLQPPLEEDPLALSNRELMRRGYPPRPDPVKAPARYARWHRIVSRPFTRVNPRMAPHPEVSFARPDLPPRLQSPTIPLPPPVAQSMFNANSSIWSGAYLTNPAAQFFWIQADWNVPGVFPLPNGPFYSAAAEWIGLDNSGTDLYQSGTDSECWNIPFWGWTITNYWMWIESLPFAPWAVTNFPVSPGDSVSVDIFVADQNGTTWFQDGTNGGLTPADNSVWFMLYNYTNGSSFWGTLPTAATTLDGLSSTPFTGTTAEFILERPTVNGSPAPLGAFGFATMWSCSYGDSEYGDRSWQLGYDGSTPFDATLTYLNMQDPSNGNLLDVPVSFPDPTSLGGYEIMWLWVNYL